jgi:NAD(P)-dependent dehydrogenase (short-subunit alcohol dehydrogenase family)
MHSLANKRILVTGASSAIGAQIARDIIGQGGKVLGTYRTTPARQLEQFSTEDSFESVCWDALNAPDFLELSSPFDGWVHCVGTIHPQPIKYLNEIGNERLFQVNYFSATHMATALVSKNLLKLGASVVFISSVSSHYPYRGGATYAASKAALETFAKALALELSAKKIRVNTLVCGLVNTPIYQASVAAHSPAEVQRMEEKYPLGIGEPSAVSMPCVFLLSDNSRWMTGSQLLLDGGLMLNA